MEKYSQLEICTWAFDGETLNYFVPAELAEKMYKVLKDLVQWDEIDQHSDDDMIAVGKYEAIIKQAKAIIEESER